MSFRLADRADRELVIVYRENGDGIVVIRLPRARSDWINVLD